MKGNESGQAFKNVVEKIKVALEASKSEQKAFVLKTRNEAQFVEHRLEVYFEELHAALAIGNTLEEAEKIAITACLSGLNVD
jgi:vacuolar-type H+-ATPase subunit I/STV1